MRVAAWASLSLLSLLVGCAHRLRIEAVVPHPEPPKPPAETAKPLNPLDPLSAVEIQAVIGALAADGKTNAESRFPFVSLAEPEKSEVLAWSSGKSFSRRASVVVKEGVHTYEALVDVAAKSVLSWKEVPGVQPSILMEEFLGIADVVKADPQWKQAMKKRGYDDVAAIACMPLSAGYYGVAAEEGKRLLRVPCYDTGKAKNYWGRPIEGLLAIVDLNEKKVLEVIDEGIVPVPSAPADYDAGSVGKLRDPLPGAETPKPGYTVLGHRVRWQNWRFHLRTDPRAGLVISQVAYEDGDRTRSVLYEGNVAELFVPYMDPAAGWYFRTYMDMGEYGVGKLASTLVPGADCPRGATFFGDAIADDHGAPVERPRIACVFEREAGDVAWRHYEFVRDATESRPARELVARLVATVGNYDYVFDWVFRQDGTIKVAVGATGIDEVKAVKARNATDKGAEVADAYGRFVAEQTVAVNHDHFFSYRLDFDVDGTENSFVEDELVAQKTKDGPRKSLWVVESKTLDHEKAAELHMKMSPPTTWRVVNPKLRGPGGYPVGFELRPGHNAMSLLDPDDAPAQRAGFTKNTLWVTPYAADERWAAGDYPNQAKGGDGLPRWTKNDRRIDARDIVLWYTLGFHHVVRAEDWPVLPTSWHEFEIRPVNFFARNPALDLPPAK